MVTINIDGRSYSVEPNGNLLDTCLSLGIDIPYFCFHPALGSVGSCRLCAVKKYRDKNDKTGRITISCMEPVTDGMIISVNDNEVKEFQSSVIESLMINHPHDCPICDEGGECHLQDMVVMTGHNYRRYEFKKRTYKNQYLGPFINHEMNRCIQCYRCIRFYKDYAGGKDLGVFGSHNHLYFGRFEEGTLENEFSGNLIEVCPTGVFTDKTLKKHYTRKWDLTNAPSICPHCAIGCNTIQGERYGILRRTLNRYNSEINGYFLCDRGRFGYEYVNSDNRLRNSMVRKEKSANFSIVTNHEAIQKAVEIISSGKSIGIGSPRSSLESNYALLKLVGKDNFYAGISENEFSLIKEIKNIYESGSVSVASIKIIEKAEAVIILGEDITNTAPRVALAVRQSIKNKPMAIATRLNIPPWNNSAVKNAVVDTKGPLVVTMPYSTKTDDIASFIYRQAPINIARFCFALASSIHKNAPGVIDLPDNEKELINDISKILKDCQSFVVIAGTQLGNKDIIHAAANIVCSLESEGKKAGLLYIVPENNSLGLAMLSDKNLNQAFDIIEKDEIENVIVLENDLHRRIEKSKIDSAFNKVKNIMAFDSINTPTVQNANMVFSSSTNSESEGTFLNTEGRMQRYFSVFSPDENIIQSWKWLGEIYYSKFGNSKKYDFDTLVKEISIEIPELAKIIDVAPKADFRVSEMKIPRQTQRFSGRTSMQANITVSEPKPPEDINSPLAFSMEGHKGLPPSELTSFYWSPGWNSVQANNKYLKELNKVLKGKDPGIKLFNFEQAGNHIFFDNIPKAFVSGDQLLLVHVNHIFGSEELSAFAPGIAERKTEAILFINDNNAAHLGIKENEIVKVECGGSDINYKVKIDLSLPDGIAGVSAGLPGLAYFQCSSSGMISK